MMSSPTKVGEPVEPSGISFFFNKGMRTLQNDEANFLPPIKFHLSRIFDNPAPFFHMFFVLFYFQYDQNHIRSVIFDIETKTS